MLPSVFVGVGAPCEHAFEMKEGEAPLWTLTLLLGLETPVNCASGPTNVCGPVLKDAEHKSCACCVLSKRSEDCGEECVTEP